MSIVGKRLILSHVQVLFYNKLQTPLFNLTIQFFSNIQTSQEIQEKKANTTSDFQFSIWKIVFT